MQHDLANGSWLSGSDDRGEGTIKQLLIPRVQSLGPVCDPLNPEATTAGSVLDSLSSGYYQLNIPSRPPHQEGLFRNADEAQIGGADGEATSAIHCGPLVSGCKPLHESREKAEQIVHKHAVEGSVTASSNLTLRQPADEELQAFSRKLQQALLAVKREAEDGFQTAKASVYRRLVEQLNVDRENELQRLEEARQEAECARTLLSSLRKSKEATEERLRRMFIFVRRRTLRQQARWQQQEALQRWKSFAMRRRRQRREQAFVTAARERSGVLRVFFPWRIAVLETASARRQQSAARHAQSTMEYQVRLMQAERAEQEQVLQQLRKQLQDETAMRVRLQENLCHIFLQGASAVYGSKSNGCREALSENTATCPLVRLGNLRRQTTLASGGSDTRTPQLSQTATLSAENKRNGTHGDDTPFHRAIVNIADKKAQETPSRTKMEAVSRSKSLIAPGAPAAAQQQQLNTRKKGTFVTCNANGRKPICDGCAVEGARPLSLCAPSGQSIQVSNVRSQVIQGRLAGVNSLEVIGQMLAPHTTCSSLSVAAAGLAGVENSAPQRAVPPSCGNRMPSTWVHGLSYDLVRAENLHLQAWGRSETKGQGECHTSGTFLHQPSTANVQSLQPPAVRRRRVHLSAGDPSSEPESNAVSGARAADPTSNGPCLNSSTDVEDAIHMSLPRHQSTVELVADVKHRARISKLPEATGGNRKTHVLQYEGKAVPGHPKRTLTYPGGIEANQRDARQALNGVTSAAHRNVRLSVRKANKTPNTSPLCLVSNTDADRLHRKKDCSWVRSCYFDP